MLISLRMSRLSSWGSGMPSINVVDDAVIAVDVNARR